MMRQSRVVQSLEVNNERMFAMQKYVCTVCGYVYDPEAGESSQDVAPGTKWEDVREDFLCPDCGVGKDSFEAQ